MKEEVLAKLKTHAWKMRLKRTNTRGSIMSVEIIYQCLNNKSTLQKIVSGDFQDLGRPEGEELMLFSMNPLLTVEEMDRLMGWHLGVSICFPIVIRT